MARKRMGYGSFFCWNCGDGIEKGKRVCPNCSAHYSGARKYGDSSALGAGGIGWSNQIGHTCFKRYAQNYRRYSYIWLIALSVFVPILLVTTDDVSLDAEGLMVIGVVVSIFWVFGLGFLAMRYGRNHPDWEGVVEDKRIEQRTGYRKDKDGQKYTEQYTDFIVYVRRQDGALHEIKVSSTGKVRECPAKFEYFNIGDCLHYHGGKYLRYIEKYDKSFDTVIFFASCGQMLDTRDNFCELCGSILLKGAPVTHTGANATSEQ